MHRILPYRAASRGYTTGCSQVRGITDCDPQYKGARFQTLLGHHEDTKPRLLSGKLTVAMPCLEHDERGCDCGQREHDIVDGRYDGSTEHVQGPVEVIELRDD